MSSDSLNGEDREIYDVEAAYDVGYDLESVDNVDEAVSVIWNRYGGDFDIQDVIRFADYVSETWSLLTSDDLVERAEKFEEADGSPKYLENFDSAEVLSSFEV